MRSEEFRRVYTLNLMRPGRAQPRAPTEGAEKEHPPRNAIFDEQSITGDAANRAFPGGVEHDGLLKHNALSLSFGAGTSIPESPRSLTPAPDPGRTPKLIPQWNLHAALG